MDRLRHPERAFITVGVAFDAATWSFYLAAIVWWTVVLDFGPLQLVLLGTVLEVTVLLTEIPTGVVADRFSRKWSVIISYAVMAVSMVLAVATENYGVMLVSQALFGLGYTFRSGADVAWLTDEMTWLQKRDGGGDKPPDLSGILLRRHRLGMVAGLFALVPTIIFGRSVEREVIFVCGAALAATAVLLAFVMTDHFRLGKDEDEHPASFREILRDGFDTTRNVRPLRLLVVVMVLLGLGAEALDRLGFAEFLNDGDFAEDSIVWVGVLFMVLGAFGVVTVALVERGLERGASLTLLAVVLVAVSAGGALIAAIAPAIGIAVGLAMQDPCREALFPVSAEWTNRHAPEASRATVHSFIGQAHGIGEAVGGISLAALAEAAGVRWAIFGSAILWTIATFVANAARSDDPAEPRPSDDADPDASAHERADTTG